MNIGAIKSFSNPNFYNKELKAASKNEVAQSSSAKEYKLPKYNKVSFGMAKIACSTKYPGAALSMNDRNIIQQTLNNVYDIKKQ